MDTDNDTGLDIDFDIEGESPAPPEEEGPLPIAITGQVAVAGHVTTREEAADKSSYRTVAFAAGDQKVQLFGFDRRRTRAVLVVSGTGPVWIGDEAQCAAVFGGQTAGGGAALATGTQLTLLSKDALWAVCAPAQTGTLTVVTERRNEI